MTSFVYFDIGGVLVLDFSGTNKWKRFKEKIGITVEKEKIFDIFFNKYEVEVNGGRDIQTLIPLMKRKFGVKLPDDYPLLTESFVNQFEINKSIWPVVGKIKEKCRVGLLTNMYFHMLGAIENRRLMPSVEWDVIIDSSVEKLVKPDPRIFELAEKRADAKGKEILFVENSPGNIAVAKSFGWQTFLYDPIRPKESSQKLAALF